MACHTPPKGDQCAASMKLAWPKLNELTVALRIHC